jgi:4'-phosphopantetheinyl transferase
VSSRRREISIRARGVLRALLGSYLGIDPKTVRFAIGEHGKPDLAADPSSDRAASLADLGRQPDAMQFPPRRRPRLSFNVSHSGALALYAFTYEGPVGVDVEVSRRPSNDRTAGIKAGGADRWFDEPARRSLDEVAIAARAFGREEARRLEGLEPAISRREFVRTWVRYEAALKCLGTGIGGTEAACSDEDLWVAELDVGGRAAAAIALERPPGEVRWWNWPPQTVQ